MTNAETPAAAHQARCLLRASRSGTLATQANGQPFASLVTPATDGAGAVLLLLSGLAAHTRHLRAEGRCSIMVAGEPSGANPQTAPRLTLTGIALPEPDAGLKRRWVARHPYAAFYADLADFQLWRLQPAAAMYVAGFAQAHRLTANDLLPGNAAVSALAQAEARIIGHCNGDHPDALDEIARAHGGAGPGWRMVACDVDGFDLALADSVMRVPFPDPVDDAQGVRAALVRLAHAARNPLVAPAGPAV